MTTITGVQASEMPLVWEQVEGFFRTFAELSKNEVTVAELLHQVLEGRRQCWAVWREGVIIACALTEIVGQPTKAVQITFAAGKDRHDWRDAMVREIEAWGQSHGVVRCRIIGRKGWAREMPHYREISRVIERELPYADV